MTPRLYYGPDGSLETIDFEENPSGAPLGRRGAYNGAGVGYQLLASTLRLRIVLERFGVWAARWSGLMSLSPLPGRAGRFQPRYAWAGKLNDAATSSTPGNGFTAWSAPEHRPER